MFRISAVIDVSSTTRGTWGVWLTLTSVLHDLGRWFGVAQAAHLTCTSLYFFIFCLAFNKEITPWHFSAEQRRHHTSLLSLHSCFCLYGEVCAKNSSKHSSGIAAKLLHYITEQSIDTLGWTDPPLITSTHNFKCCRVLLIVESSYSAYQRHSVSFFWII